MSEVILGQLRDEANDQRDAIHVAVFPVVASELLLPGSHVGLIEKGSNLVTRHSEDIVGVIDPFLVRPVKEGQGCWLFLYPNTVTGMRHEWEHPLFVNRGPSTYPLVEDNLDVKASVKWLQDFAASIGIDYEDVMQACDEFKNHGDYYIFHGLDTPEECFNQCREMWKHYHIVIGEPMPADIDDDCTPFSCSC